ncbi:hypothetical protein PVAND_016718 [Polypedilum vanderplanki]|uniref:Uncharacterized protein n=1 Tax=Polypedilum vanderplanki TaxID=319348 RepID=A0A9J6BGL6_POLVA|nr:hypothetical protein PVAND_016718 [Polypedilum vanderplanki]
MKIIAIFLNILGLNFINSNPQMSKQGMQQPQMSSQGMEQLNSSQTYNQEMQQPQQISRNQRNYQQQQTYGSQSNQKKDLTPEEKAAYACFEDMSKIVLPFQCCFYPIMTITRTNAASCPDECPNNSNKNCALNCLNKKLKLFDENNKMNAKGWIDFFTAGIAEGKITTGNWSEIIENSANKCVEKLSSEENKNLRNDLSIFMNNAVNCMFLSNYIACPTLVENEQCKISHQFFADPQGCFAKYTKYFDPQSIWSRKRQ